MSTSIQKLMAAGEHPMTWDDFKGQESAKNTLRRAAKTAKRRGAPMDHALISSPMPGIGKTSLALLTGMEMGEKCYVRVLTGAVTPTNFLHHLLQLEDGDILVIDEIHQVFAGGRGKGEYLLHYLQQGSMVMENGDLESDLPQVTVIGATTNPEKILKPVLDRFTYRPQLLPYTVEEGADIAASIAGRILGEVALPPVDRETAQAIATATGCRPRQMQRLLRAVRDLAVDDAIVFTDDGKYELDAALAEVNLTADGLTEDALAYMGVLATHGRNRPLGKQQVADIAGLAGDMVAEAEGLLMDRGYLQLARGGRALSVAGIRRAMTAGLITGGRE